MGYRDMTHINQATLHQLVAYAQQHGMAVDQLLNSWMSAGIPAQQNGVSKPNTEPPSINYGSNIPEMFQHHSMAQLMIDPASHTIIDANQAALDFYGYAHADIIGMTLDQLSTRTYVYSFRETNSPPQVYEHQLANGQRKSVQIYFGTFTHHGRDLYHAIIVDVTDYQIMANTAAEFVERYRTLSDFNTDWAYLQHTDGSLHYLSPASELITGYTIEELKAQPTLIEQMIYPEDLSIWQSHTHDHTDENAPQIIEFRIRTKTGIIRWIEHSCRPTFNESGELIGYRVRNRDITATKRDHERSFELALERERMRLLTRFIQEAAHEFRTPLSVIATQAYLLAAGSDHERAADNQAVIQRQIERITTLTDSLLLITQLDNLSSITLMPIDVSEIMSALYLRYNTRPGDTPHINYRVPRPMPQLLGEPHLLGQAFEQILDNAVRFTPADGQITITAGITDEHIWLTIADTGIGIAPANLQKIFRTFWRHDSVHSTPGLGLGLSIAQRILTLHGASIGVESTEGVGSKFTVTLPLMPHLMQ